MLHIFGEFLLHYKSLYSRLVKVPKGSKMVNLDVFDNLGPFWANDFFAPYGQSRVWRRCSGAKNQYIQSYEKIQIPN